MFRSSHRILMLLVATFIFIGLVFSGYGNQPAAAKEKSKDWTGTITLWYGPEAWNYKGSNDRFGWIKAKLAEFQEQNPGVKVELVQVAWAEMNQKLAIAVSGGGWPDVAAVGGSQGSVNLQLVKQGVLEPLNSFFTKEELADYFPAALQAYSYQGKLYGVPSSVVVYAMMLNLDLFKERGVTPPKDGIWTYSDFVKAAQRLTFDRNGDGKTDVYGFSTYVMPGYYEAWPFLYMDGGRPLSEDGTRYTFDSKAAISGLQKLADLKFKYKVAPPEMGSADVAGTFQAFANPQQRTVAMEPWASWAIGSLQNRPEYKMHFAVAGYPVGNTGSPVALMGAKGWLVLAQRDKAKLRKVAELVKYLASPEEQLVWAQQAGNFPSRRSVLSKNPFANNPQMEQAQAMLEKATPLPQHLNWGKIDDRIQREIQLVLSGQKSPQQALEDAGKSVAPFVGSK